MRVLLASHGSPDAMQATQWLAASGAPISGADNAAAITKSLLRTSDFMRPVAPGCVWVREATRFSFDGRPPLILSWHLHERRFLALQSFFRPAAPTATSAPCHAAARTPPGAQT